MRAESNGCPGTIGENCCCFENIHGGCPTYTLLTTHQANQRPLTHSRMALAAERSLVRGEPRILLSEEKYPTKKTVL